MVWVSTLFIGSLVAMGVVALVAFIKAFFFVCLPSEIMIFSGRKHMMDDGTVLGHRVVHGGWAIRIPLIEKVGRLDLRSLPIKLQVENAYSKGGIPLHVQAIAYVKVSSDPTRVNHAIERFLGRNPLEIQKVAKESLEGQLRGIIARMTPEEINEDRLRFAEEMMKETDGDFFRLGLALDTLKVQSVSDDVSYLDNIGRKRLANVLRDAEIAESTYKADADEAEAEAERRGEVAVQVAETEIKRRENAYRETVATLEATASSEEERAEQGQLQAQATAELKLQEIRVKLQNLKLQADVVLPASAQKEAAAHKAKGEAANIAADGNASADVLAAMHAAWLEAGGNARDIFLFQQLDSTIQAVTSQVAGINLDEVVLLDCGDGQALSKHIASLPRTVAAVFDAMRDTTGIDVVEIISHQLQQKNGGQA